MDSDEAARMSPYNTVMHSELNVTVREDSNPTHDTDQAAACYNPYSDIQVFTSPLKQQPTRLPAPSLPPPSTNMSTDQFLTLLNQLITTQEPTLSTHPQHSHTDTPTILLPDHVQDNFGTRNHFSTLTPITSTMDDLQTLSYKKDSGEKRTSLSKSFSVPSLLTLSSLQPPESRSDPAPHDLTSGEQMQPRPQTALPCSLHFSDKSMAQTTDLQFQTNSTFPSTNGPPMLVNGPQSLDQLPPGVLTPHAHSLLAPAPPLPRHSEMQPLEDKPLFTYTSSTYPTQYIYQLSPSTATTHTPSTSYAPQPTEPDPASRDLLGQLDLLKKREQMLQTAKMQLEDKCASLMDKVEIMETRQHRSEHELEGLRSIRGELEQKNNQLEQYNQLLQQQLEGSRQHVAQLERRIDGLNQQCRLKDEANLQNTELYQKLEATDKMISVFQERLDSARLQLSQQEALINSLDTRARAAESALAQSQQEVGAVSQERSREKERYNQDLQRVQTELHADKQRREQEIVRIRNQLLQENEKFKEEYNRLREEYENQKMKFDRLLEEFRLTQTEVGRKQKFISELEQEARERQSDVANLKATVSKYESMEDNYKRTIMRMEEDVRHLQHTNNRLHNIGSIQTTFQTPQSDSKFQYASPSQLDSPSTYSRAHGSSPYPRHWTDPSPDVHASKHPDTLTLSKPRASVSNQVWPADSDGEYPNPLSQDNPPYVGSFENISRPHSSVLKDKLNCSFDVTYPNESLPSPTLERVKGMAPRSDPRKRMAWITEETEVDPGSSKSDEEKYRLLLSTDQQTHKSQIYKSSRPGSESGYYKAEKPYSSAGDISEIEDVYDGLQHERQMLESALSRIPASGRTSRQSRQKREDIETRLDVVVKNLGSVRMKMRMLGILKTN